jgi:putative ABC transport system permease protein
VTTTWARQRVPDADTAVEAPGGRRRAADGPGRRRPRGSLGVIGTPPWRRAPLLAAGQPGAALAVLVATAILGIASASGPLFLSSAGSGALARILGSYCPEQAVPGVVAQQPGYGPLMLPGGQALDAGNAPAETARQDAAVRAAFRQHGVPAPYAVSYLTRQQAVGVGGAWRSVALFARPGVLDEVTLLSGRRSARGVWVSDLLAADLGVRAGQTVQIAGRRYPVAGVYRDLIGVGGYGGDLPAYWCSWAGFIVPRVASDEKAGVTDSLVLADPDTVAAVAGRNGRLPQRSWYSGLDVSALTAPAAGTASQHAAGVADTAAELAQADDLIWFQNSGRLGEAADRAALVQSGLAGPVAPTALVATLVALLLVAGAGVYWAERRAAEVRLLAARGVGPAALGAKAVLEMAVPAVAGGLLGWLAALALVRRLGPSPLLEPAAPVRALVTVALALLAGLALLGLVGGLRARATVERPIGRRRGVWPWVPWEALLLGAAAAAYFALKARGAVATERDVARVDPLVVIAPLLALGGLLGLAARVVAAGIPALRRLTARLPAAGYLASRRLAGSRLATVAVLVSVAVPVGVLVFSRSLTATIEATTRAKAATYVGAEVALRTHNYPGRIPDPRGHGSPVTVISNGRLGDLDASVLGVDPATFARYVYWQDDFAGAGLPDLLSRLRPAAAGEPVPAILVTHDPGLTVGAVRLRTTRLPIRVVGHATGFPGARLLAAPMLVVRADALQQVDPYSQRVEEVWTTHAERPMATAALAAGGVQIDGEVTPTDILSSTVLYPVTWTFGYLAALAALTGAITITGLLLYVAVRQRARIASYALSHRLGLSRRAHLVSIAVELLVVLIAGAAAGAAAARAALGPIAGLLDVDAGRPPGPRLVLPLAVLAAVGVGVLVLAGLATLAAQWAADRQRPADVMRLGG